MARAPSDVVAGLQVKQRGSGRERGGRGVDGLSVEVPEHWFGHALLVRAVTVPTQIQGKDCQTPARWERVSPVGRTGGRDRYQGVAVCGICTAPP